MVVRSMSVPATPDWMNRGLSVTGLLIRRAGGDVEVKVVAI